MAEILDSPPLSPTKTQELQNDEETQIRQKPDLLGDIVLWRRKQRNILILFAATTLWTVMEIYQYNFITIVSYVTMAIVLVIFLWGNIHRVLKKEAPDLSRMEINEATIRDTANSFRQMAEKGIRFMFRVSAEREWYVFGGAVAFLYLLSMVASCTDFLTLCYIGLVGGMSVPVIYLKNQHGIKLLGEKMKMESHKLYQVIGEKSRKTKEKMAGIIKEKKTE